MEMCLHLNARVIVRGTNFEIMLLKDVHTHVLLDIFQTTPHGIVLRFAHPCTMAILGIIHV